MLKINFKSKTKIVATEAGKQIGYLNFNYERDASKKRNIFISYMYVKSEYRRKGIGSKMLKFLLAKKKNITWINFWTGKEIEKNKGTNIYIKNGFQKLAYQEDYYEKGVGTTLFVKRIK